MVLLFEGDYVLAKGSTSYARVVDILADDYVLLESGDQVLADHSEVADYRSAKEYEGMLQGNNV
tara:strand:- start:419 stop:610 length:192 start_codon:yes stop_codon:yes gene_type:complete